MPLRNSAQQLQSRWPCGRDTEKSSCYFNLFKFKKALVPRGSLTAQPPMLGVRLTDPQLQCDQTVIARRADSRAPLQTYRVRTCISAGSRCVHWRLGGPALDYWRSPWPPGPSVQDTVPAAVHLPSTSPVFTRTVAGLVKALLEDASTAFAHLTQVWTAVARPQGMAQHKAGAGRALQGQRASWHGVHLLLVEWLYTHHLTPLYLSVTIRGMAVILVTLQRVFVRT